MQDLSLNSNTFHGPWQSVAIINQPVGVLKRDKFAAAACFGFIDHPGKKFYVMVS